LFILTFIILITRTILVDLSIQVSFGRCHWRRIGRYKICTLLAGKLYREEQER